MLNFFRREHKRILVVRPDRIGDVVLSTPVYHMLKQSFTDSYIGALVSTYTEPLLYKNPYIDSVITDDAKNTGSDDKSFRQKVSEIRSHKFDTALLLMPTKRLAYMLFLAGIPYRVGVGHILYEIITLMHGVSRQKYIPLRHESDYMLDLARKIGADKIWSTPEIFLDGEEKDSARRFLERKGLDTNRPVVAIHPGSGHSSPNWQVERYTELAEMLLQNGFQILVSGDVKEIALANHFRAGGEGNIVTSFGELSLRQLARVLSQVNVFVSSSTGPMHIASAVGTPTVSMFCPLTACSPKLWGPLGNKSRIIMPPDNFCQAQCPGDPHICTFGNGTEGITVQSVFEAVMDMSHKKEPVFSSSH